MPAVDTRPWSTTDIGVAAFLRLKGYKILKAGRQAGRNSRFVFVFDDPGGTADGHAIDYANSDCQRFDAEIRNLKKLIHGRPSR